MRLNHLMTVLLSVFFQSVILRTPKMTYASEISSKLSIIEDDQGVLLEQELSYIRFDLKSRLLASDDTCVNACEDEVVSSFQASGSLVEETEDEDAAGSRGIFGRLTGLFDGNQNIFSRLINGLFRLFNRRHEDDPKYLIPTDTILPLISNYSTKVKSLATMMRQEGVKDAALSKTPDAILMIYNISAENMESVATLLDPILVDMQQYETMDVRAISCNMMQILTLLRDVTVPNIELMAQLIYTKSNNGEMKDMFNQYTKSSENAASSTASTSTSSSEDGTCSDFSTPTTSARVSGDPGEILLQFLFNNDIDVGPILHIVRIILLIVLFPLTFVVSIVGVIVLILYLLTSFLRTLLGVEDTTQNDGFQGLILVVLFTITIGAPFFTARAILRNILGFFEDILDPFLPDRPTPAPTIFTLFPTPTPNIPMKAPLSLRANAPVNPTASARDAQPVGDIVYRISAVLESPMDTTVLVFQDENTFLNTNEGEDEEIDCEMAALKCNNDALMDILPF